MKTHAAAGAAFAFALTAGAQAPVPAPQLVPVAMLAAAPTVDGDLAEWSAGAWTHVNLVPAVKAEDRVNLGLDPRPPNAAAHLTVQLKAAIVAGRIYFAVRWPDEAPDTDYRLWERKGGAYVEGRQRDDAFSMRFAMRGELDRSMLSAKAYTADVWFWSAGRSQPAGRAEDMTHRVSTRMIDDAAEYEVTGLGTVYIKKMRDAGAPLYRNVRPAKDATAERLPSIETNPKPAGSVADVAARGAWRNGHWHLELSRALDTGNDDDVALLPGSRVAFQIAVFNRSADENKSISELLLLDLRAAR